MFETGTPETSTDIIASLSRLQGEGEWWMGELPPDVFFLSQDGHWSPAGQIGHLIKSIKPVAMGLGFPRVALRLLFPPRSEKRSFTQVRETYLGRLKGGVQAGRFSPAKRPAPVDPAVTKKHILDTWHKSTALLLKRIPGWSEPSLDECGMPHPALGRLSVREMLYFTIYHQSHHLTIAASRVTANTDR